MRPVCPGSRALWRLQGAAPGHLESGVLTVVNYVLIVVLGLGHYLLLPRFAPDVPVDLSLGVAILAGLLMCLANYGFLDRRFGRRARDLNLNDWLYFILVFAVTVGIMLSISQLVLGKQLPAPRTGHHLFMLAANLPILGLSSFQTAKRLGEDRRSHRGA